MAGTFTHIMICNEGITRKSVIGSELWQFLNKYSEFLYLGAVSPDLPYLSFKTGHVNWADVMHYEKTNSLVISGFEELRNNWPLRTPAHEVQFAWLLGFVSHLVADATIHPIVNATVGNYAEHKKEHRLCEMTQDSLIFHEIKDNDISYAEFSERLEFCGKSEYFDQLMDFWKRHLLIEYPEKGEEPHPNLWFNTYTDKAIDAAEGGSKLVGLFRHYGLAQSYIYHPKEEIVSRYPEYYRDYYEVVRMPGGTGPFKEEGFERAVKNVVDAWKSLRTGLGFGLTVASVVKNWNLDTGADMETGVFTFWV